MNKPKLHLAILAFAVAVLNILAADWPQWRGAGREDVSPETGLLKAWPAEGPKLAWKTTGLGSGFSGVAVAGERIYSMGESAEGSYVIALSRADGSKLWTAKLGKAGAPGWGGFSGPRGTPTVDGSQLFALGQYGELVCLENANGKEVWRKHLESDLGGKVPEWGYAESPLVDGDLVLCTPGGAGGAIAALNKQTGATVWRSKEFTDDAQYASLIVADIGGVRQCIQLTMASVAGVALQDGKLLWKAARKGATAVIPTPIYKEGFVYVASGYGIGCNLFKVTASGGSFSVEEIYKNRVMKNHHGGVVLLGDHLYGHSDGVGWVCQEFATGKSVWEEKEKLGKGSLTCADGHLYLRHEEGPGTVALIEATPAGYKETGRFNQPDRSGKQSWPHPVVSGGRLYLRDQDVLLCYDVKAR